MRGEKREIKQTTKKMYKPVSVFPFAFQSPHDISHSIEFLYFPLFVSVRAYQQLRSPLLSECAYKMERKKTERHAFKI